MLHIAYEYALFFFLYAFMGWCCEVAFAAFKTRSFVNRGFLNGPICPIYGVGVVLVVTLLKPFNESIGLLYVGAFVVTSVLEWLTGFVLEKLFHEKWWDYSDMPLNIQGYVCLLFSLLWGVGCVFIVRVVHPLVKTGVRLMPEVIGWVLLAILVVLFIIDLCVTVKAVIKLSRRLDKLEEIAAELKKISDEIGSGIYGETIRIMEKTDEWKENAEKEKQAYMESMERKKAAAAELKEKYEAMLKKPDFSAVSRRILKAFPNFSLVKRKDLMEQLRSLWDKL